MTVEHVKNLLSELCYFSEVDITQTFSFNGIRILQVKCITMNSLNTFELTYPDSDKVDTFSDIDKAAKVVTNIISKRTPV
ncbi:MULTISPECIES: hypothetical protein [Peribacillus]|uniref:hypothetical protein n=1 Tax=Peribacillus TaxID=2675229 RepID=UPI001F4E276B|nr:MULTISPECIES: hypothetical protein [unclassified Peribacillus]MCK1982189.1 hypothetical protein [Peribacillus sp. Aquil_B1]MCK2007459.1 hypothetical protein [Peribacillus sp. Aquil_B8]